MEQISTCEQYTHTDDVGGNKAMHERQLQGQQQQQPTQQVGYGYCGAGSDN